MKKVVEDINVYAVVNNKKSIKNLVVKTKNIGCKLESRKFVYTPRTSDTNQYCL